MFRLKTWLKRLIRKLFSIPELIHSTCQPRVKCNRCPFRLTRWWVRAYLGTRVKFLPSRTVKSYAQLLCLRQQNTFILAAKGVSKCGTSANPVKHQSASWIAWWVGNCRQHHRNFPIYIIILLYSNLTFNSIQILISAKRQLHQIG